MATNERTMQNPGDTRTPEGYVPHNATRTLVFPDGAAELVKRDGYDQVVKLNGSPQDSTAEEEVMQATSNTYK